MPAAPLPADPILVALDVGSSSVRALAFDRKGGALDVGVQRPYEPTTTPDGGVEIDADRLVELTAETLDGLLAALGARVDRRRGRRDQHLLAHACSASGRTIARRRRVYSWADTRSAGAVDALRARVDEKAYHARVGCRLHTSYLPARLWWLRERDPAAFRRTRRWVSFGEYLGLRLFGELRTSVSMASGTGLFDQWAQRWDPGILEVLGLGVEHLGPVVDLGQPFRGLRPEFARALARAGDGARGCRRWATARAPTSAPGARRRSGRR